LRGNNNLFANISIVIEINNITTLGIISDTHGLLREEAIAALQGCDLILHAGDIGTYAVLEQLQQIAPTIAVRGNIDHGQWAEGLPEVERVMINGMKFCLLHNIGELSFDPQAEGLRAVIYGHSHKPRNEEQSGLLYFNPASAGPRRFSLPVAVGRISFQDGAMRAEIVELDC
jgi:hypothetical protein